jgi:tRNA (adenine57-N1/adenine58-N1)-methyltransferase
MLNSLYSGAIAQVGDLIHLVSPTNKTFIIRLEAGGHFHTHRGILNHDELIGQPYGSEVATHSGKTYFMLQPSIADILQELRRNTQILYPKDLGFILITLGIGPGLRVVEAGTGSGALTIALAWLVGDSGRVYSYEVRPENHNLARKNLEGLGLQDRVSLKLRDISEGFDETGVDALFLDVPNPYDYLPQVRAALKSGGRFGTLLPTTNQVSKLLEALTRFEFGFIDVAEVILRYYKPVPERLRPVDRMVAHTGYLIFARPMVSIGKRHRYEAALAQAAADELEAQPLDLAEGDAANDEAGTLEA